MSEQRAVPARPRSITVAVGFAVGAAVLNIVIGALALTQIPRVLEVLQGRTNPSPGVAAALLVVIAAISLVYAVAVVVLAILFRSGRTWARIAFFGASLLSLFPLLSPNGPAIAVILLLAVADLLLFRSEVSAWVRALRGLRPA